MTWFDDPSVIRFDVCAGAKPAEWFHFTALPGLGAMAVIARGVEGRPVVYAVSVVQIM